MRPVTVKEPPARRPPKRPSRKSAKVYRRRRLAVVSALLISTLALIFAAFLQTSETTSRSLPIDPNNSGPDAALASAMGIHISTPVRPENLTGLGYHPEGESFLEMAPRGENLSTNALFRLFGGSTPEQIKYHMMDSAGRLGPRTGALDVGAEAGAEVYAPVTGTVTAIRPDPVIRDANIVEIKPADNPDIRISVSLVQEISSEIGPKTPVTAGMTRIGSVADSSAVLKPQLSSYTSGSGNHVTIFATQVN